jgi:hypothetical protein
VTRGRSVVVGLVATAMLLLQAGPSAAEDPGVSFVSPEASSRVSGSIEVTLHSTSSNFLRLGLVERQVNWLPPEPVGAEGLTIIEVPTWGFASLKLRAQNCLTEDPASCLEASTTRRAVITNNAPPVLVEPSGYVFTKPADDGPLRVRLTGEGPGPLRVWLDGNGSGPGVTGEKDADLEVDTSQYPNGTHEVYRSWCNPLFPMECNDARWTGVHVTIRHNLPAEVIYAAAPVSPNGDGRHDTIGFTVHGDPEVPQHALWRLFRSGRALSKWRTEDFGSVGGIGTPPEHFQIDVSRGWLNQELTSGTYELRLRFQRDLAGHHYQSETRLPVAVDLTPVKVRRLRVSHEVFNPMQQDGYRDSVRVTGAVEGGSAQTTRVRVLDRRGHVVRQLTGSATTDGLRKVRWNGLMDNGEVAPLPSIGSASKQWMP